MKKYCLSLFFALAALNSQAQLVIDGQSYQVDTLKNHLIGPGTRYTAIRLTGPHSQNVFFVKADLKNPHIEFKQVLGRDSIYGTERPSATAQRKSTANAVYFAGTNGDFFDTSPAYPAGFNGYPIGGNMGDGEIAKIPSTWNLFAIDENKIPDIGYMTYSGTVKFNGAARAITSCNHTREDNALVLYNRHNGKVTRTNQYGTEVLIELLDGEKAWGVNKILKAKVLQIATNKGNMAIPPGKAVLSGHRSDKEVTNSAAFLDQLSVDDEIEINLELTMDGTTKAPWTQMTGGDNYKTMLKNGVVETGNVWNERHPRTGIGYSVTRDTLIFCVVDGRSSASEGVTTKELAQIMQSAGAYTAVNMDGGGSSGMYINAYGGPVNKGSDGSERASGNSVFVVSTAPADPVISKIIPYNENFALPRYAGYTPQFYGYNQYGTLLDMDLQNVQLSCDPSLGIIDGNQFMATGTESGYITATFNGTVTASIHIDFIPVSDMKIRLDTVIVDNRSEYPIEVQAFSSGNTFPIMANALSWNVENPEICEVVNGKVIALQNGTTWIHGTVDDTKDSLVVSVETPPTNRIPMTDFQLSNWKIAATSKLNAILNADNLPEQWTEGIAANFKHVTVRAPYIRLSNTNMKTYGLPDTIKVVLNTGGVAINKAIVYIGPNNEAKTVSKEFTSFSNGDIELSIALDQILNVSDRAIYPIHFNNIYFLLGTATTAGQNYTLALKEIAQIYKGFPEVGIRHPKTTRFLIYPNPVTGSEIYIQFKDEQEHALQAEIYTLAGQKIQTEMLYIQGETASFTQKNLPAGAYLMKISSNKSVDTVKLIIQ